MIGRRRQCFGDACSCPAQATALLVVPKDGAQGLNGQVQDLYILGSFQ